MYSLSVCLAQCLCLCVSLSAYAGGCRNVKIQGLSLSPQALGYHFNERVYKETTINLYNAETRFLPISIARVLARASGALYLQSAWLGGRYSSTQGAFV